MIFLASTPSGVFFVTCSRSMSPVARWHTLYFSRMLGACVPLPAMKQSQLQLPLPKVQQRLTGAWRAHQDEAEAVGRREADSSRRCRDGAINGVLDSGRGFGNGGASLRLELLDLDNATWCERSCCRRAKQLCSLTLDCSCETSPFK